MVIHFVKRSFSAEDCARGVPVSAVVGSGGMATYLEQSLQMLEQFEGSIPWMYQDIAGNVTVAVGLLLSDCDASQKLPFQLAGISATAAEVAVEFGRVQALPMGRPALFYRKAGGPELGQADIDRLLRDVLIGFEGKVRAAVPHYDGLPEGVKLALLDMAYNLGPHGLVKGYPHMIAAVSAGRWPDAARQCFRHGIGAARNQWTQAMFVGQVVPQMEANAEGALKLLGYGLLGAGATLWDWLKSRK